jgi:hypothetical protein
VAASSGGDPVGRAAQQHLGVVPATEREQRPGGRRGQERAVPAPQPLAGRQFGEVHPKGPAGIPLLDQGADLAGDGDRLLPQRSRLAVAALGDQRLAEGGQDLGPLGQWRAGRHQAHGRLVLGERALAAGRPQVAAEARVQQPGPDRIGGRVHGGERRPGQGDGPVGVAGQERRVGPVLQHRGPVQVEPLVGVGHLVHSSSASSK